MERTFPLTFLIAIATILAGCVGSAPVDAPVAESAVEEAEIASLSACTAHNAFVQTTEDALKPHVPANWTFTGAGSPHAILRVFHVACEDGRALLLLSTPMFPDEASLDKHENPDVVIDAFTNDASALARWNATGARASLAEFTTAFFPGGESLIVKVGGDLVLGLDVLPAAPRPPGRYEFRAVYAAGVDPIGWFWGDEVSETSTLLQFGVHLGPATRVDGADTPPAGTGARWEDVDLRYALGLPDE